MPSSRVARAVAHATLVLLPTVLPAAVRAQSAVLGTVHFPTSGTPKAHEAFVRGVLLLHSFEYPDAAAAFREAQRLDPNFAMAYWGEAMTYNHPLWRQQDREAARAVLERLGPTPEARDLRAPTPREKMYLDAVETLYGNGPKPKRDTAYSQAMARIVEAYPDDLEAKAFYALSLLGLSQGARNVPTYMRGAAVAEEVFVANPNHPGAAHYLIHAFDDPIHAILGLRAARAYAKIAPGAAHAQHMTSHIFVALGMWDDVVAANETAVGVENAARQRSGLGQVRCGHYNHWLEYGYLQQGRYREAVRLLDECRSQVRADQRARSTFAAMQAAYVVDTRDWAGPAARIALDTAGLGLDAVVADFVTGLSAAERGEGEAAGMSLRAIETRRRARAAPAQGETDPDYGTAEMMERELRAVLLFKSGAASEAREEVRRAAAIEEALPHEYGPPPSAKPPRELLGEMLLELAQPEEARREFERALERTPRRSLALLGLARAASALGDTEGAVRAYSELSAMWERADRDLPEVKEMERYLAAHAMAQTGSAP